jgi:CHAT domain-containing protein
MEDFFRRLLAGEGRARALRQAQLALMKIAKLVPPTHGRDNPWSTLSSG